MTENGHIPIPYRYLDHVADTRFIAYGDTCGTVFENAAKAMFGVIADISEVSGDVSFPVELTAPDAESLLVDWLSELLFLFDAEEVLLSRFTVGSVGETADGSLCLKAVVSGAYTDPDVHEMKTEVKAVTYNGLRIEETKDGWEAEVVLDL